MRDTSEHILAVATSRRIRLSKPSSGAQSSLPLTVMLRKGAFLLTREFACIRMYPLEPFRKLHKTVQWFHVPGACRWASDRDTGGEGEQ